MKPLSSLACDRGEADRLVLVFSHLEGSQSDGISAFRSAHERKVRKSKTSAAQLSMRVGDPAETQHLSLLRQKF